MAESLNSIMGSRPGYGTYMNANILPGTGQFAGLSFGGMQGAVIGSSAGLAAGLGLLVAALGPIGIIGGVIGGLVAAFTTSSANRKRRNLSRLEQARINTEMLWSGVKLLFDEQDVARDTTKKLGAAALVTQEGVSHDEATASALNDPFVASANLQLDFDLREIVANLAKQDSATRGESSSVGLAVISGVLTGAGIGMGITQAAARVEQNRARGASTATLLGAQLSGLQQTGAINRQIGNQTLANQVRAGSLQELYFSALRIRASSALSTSRNLTQSSSLRLNLAQRFTPQGGRITQDNLAVWNAMWGGIGGVGSFSGLDTLPPEFRRFPN